MSRKSKKHRRGRRAQPGPQPPSTRPDFDYRWVLGQANELLVRNEIKVRPDNWPNVVLDWVTPQGPDRDELARYIEAHQARLGVAWARQMLRLEVFFQVDDLDAIIVHYDRALSRYPRCALFEMYVAEQIARHHGDWWRARPMLHYAVEHLPGYARPRYELGFTHFLLGDLPGALDWFNQAVSRLTEHDAGFQASRLFYNRGITRFMLDGDRKAATADLKQALQHDPDYEQAQDALRVLRRRKVSWVPW
jgi:tetratricopeptide (TPR) repeat protein